MNKTEFLQFMGFPLDWFEFDMYPDVLFELQLSEFEREDEGAVGISTVYRPGSEHYRYGAFVWWLKHANVTSQFVKLEKLANLDPDKIMGKAVIKEIVNKISHAQPRA